MVRIPIRRRRSAALLALILVGAPSDAPAQVWVGVKGGVTFATTDFDNFGSDARAGALAGGFVTLPAWGDLYVQVEALYTMKGFATVGFLADGSSARIPYLDIPILLKYPLGPLDMPVQPMVMAGGYWGAELSCSTQGDIVELEGSDSCDGRFAGRGTADAGFIFGGGLDIDVTDRWFMLVDGRFHLGMRNLRFDPDSESARTRAWSILGGLGVRLGSGL